MQRKHFVLMLATLSFVMLGLVLFGYPPISRYVILDLNLSHTESGSITSVFVPAFALMQVPGGYLADRFGGAKTLLIFTAVVGVSPFIFIIGDNFVMALVFRALAGGACGVTFPSAVRVLSSWFSENELDSAMSIFGLGWGISQIVSSALLPLLILAADWRPPLIFTALFSLLVIGILGVLGAILLRTDSSHDASLTQRHPTIRRSGIEEKTPGDMLRAF